MKTVYVVHEWNRKRHELVTAVFADKHDAGRFCEKSRYAGKRRSDWFPVRIREKRQSTQGAGPRAAAGKK